MLHIEPHYTPDMAGEVDTAEDELREIASQHLPAHFIAAVVQVVHAAGQRQILSRMGYGEFSDRAAHEITRRILAIVGDGRNAGLRAWCVDFLAGTNVFGGKSEDQIGRRWGYTRANVSRICKDLQSTLGMLAPRGGKSDEATEVYRERAKRNHAEGKITKPKPLPWPGMNRLAAIC